MYVLHIWNYKTWIIYGDFSSFRYYKVFTLEFLTIYRNFHDVFKKPQKSPTIQNFKVYRIFKDLSSADDLLSLNYLNLFGYYTIHCILNVTFI